MADVKKKRNLEEEGAEDEESEVALALVAECQVGSRTYKAGDTWTDEADQCRMSICNPGGVVSHLECPKFEMDDDTSVRIPGDDKYAYPHCCDYVFKKVETPGKTDEKETEATA